MTESKYKTVIVDFPWPVDNVGQSKIHLSESHQKSHRPCKIHPEWFSDDFQNKYKIMTLEEIRNFPIDDYADEEAMLFLWVTCSKAEKTPVIKVGLELLDLWGFKYHQLITWDKCHSFGFWTPIHSQTEHCIVSYRGNFARLTGRKLAQMKNLIRTNRQNKHSEKPYEFYQQLAKWTPMPRIDLFARRTHAGFDGYGDQYAGEHGPLLKYIEAGEK